MDERFLIPKTLRPIYMRSLHYGHPGRDSMLAIVSNIWWPRLLREVVAIARACPQCSVSIKMVETLLKQNEVVKEPECKKKQSGNSNRLCWAVSKCRKSKEIPLVSKDHYSAWPGSNFLGKPTTERGMEFPKDYIARHGMPEVIRTEYATIFKSKSFKDICKNRLT